MAAAEADDGDGGDGEEEEDDCGCVCGRNGLDQKWIALGRMLHVLREFFLIRTQTKSG